MTDDYLVLTRQMRRCRRCREWTRWTTEKQLSGDSGICLDHAGQLRTRDEPLTPREIRRLLVRTFGEIATGERPEPAVEAPTTVGGTWLVSGRRWERPVPYRAPGEYPKDPHEMRRP